MAEPLIIIIPHRLGKQQAVARLKRGIERLRSKNAALFTFAEERWDGDRLDFRVTALAQNVTGRVEVLEEAARIELDLPWMLRAMAETIRGRIERKGTKMLEKK